jgi:hypothetical protein
MMEYLVVLAAYAYIQGGIVLFEIIGGLQAGDEQVQLYKAIGVAPEPILMVLALVFAHMVRVVERRLAESPEYKKQKAAQMSKGETGNTINMREEGDEDSDQEDMDAATKPTNNNHMVIDKDIKGNKKGGMDNPAYDIDEEVNQTPLDPGVRDKPRSAGDAASDNMAKLKDGDNELPAMTKSKSPEGKVEDEGRCCDTCINIEVRGGS